MSKKSLILVKSDRMQDNKKPDRKEDALIRMSKRTRTVLRTNDMVDVSGDGDTTLAVHQAFAEDLTDLRKSGKYTTEELNRVGFVTEDTYKKVKGAGKTVDQIWISEKKENVVLGADPEFLLFDGKNVAKANNFLGHQGQLGHDGAMAEIRPEPAASTEKLIGNMKDVLANDPNRGSITHLKWMAECYHKDEDRDYPVGGHIHIGNPKKVANMSEDKKKMFFCVLNKIIDELVSVPMARLDGDKGLKRRTQAQMVLNGGKGYGFYGEWRPCAGRLEHRTLSGLWMMHPSIAKAVFGTTKAIVDEVFNLSANKDYDTTYIAPMKYRESNLFSDNFNSWENIPLAKAMDCNLSSKSMRELLDTCKVTNINKVYMKRWMEKMKRLSTFKSNREYIEALYEILTVPIKQVDGYSRDIQRNWLGNKKFLVDI